MIDNFEMIDAADIPLCSLDSTHNDESKALAPATDTCRSHRRTIAVSKTGLRSVTPKVVRDAVKPSTSDSLFQAAGQASSRQSQAEEAGRTRRYRGGVGGFEGDA